MSKYKSNSKKIYLKLPEKKQINGKILNYSLQYFLTVAYAVKNVILVVIFNKLLSIPSKKG